MNQYSTLTPEQLDEHFSNFLVDRWSYSAVDAFSRNEKEFEKCYIYNERSRKSASAVGGSAYHAALEYYFERLQEGKQTDLPTLELEACTYIDLVEANEWKLQKTTPTIEDCKKKANTAAITLVRNFFKEKDLYEEELQDVLAVEMKLEQWLTVNGVDIPLPCHGIIDLTVELKDGRTVIIDHKSKTKFTDAEELALIRGKQAITYTLLFEACNDRKVSEVWFIENKSTKNSDGSPQLRLSRMVMDADNRKLYEAMLYEPLRRMVQAVADPDYVYLMNDYDNFCDKAEMYAFWAKTLVAEADDFNIKESKKPLIAKRQRKIRDASLAMISPKVIQKFKENASAFISYDLSMQNMTEKEKIEHVLRTFGMITQVAHDIQGFSARTFLLEVSAGIKIANIMKYRLDIANALDVPNVRISNNLVMYEGKSYLSIETPQRNGKTLLWDEKYLEDRRIPIGIDNYGKTVCWDLDNHSTPHMLICGATGSGKSVSIISTLEYARKSGVTDITIFDPKYEFCEYEDEGVKVYNEIEDIEEQLRQMVEDMQQRAKQRGWHPIKLVIFDEFADAVSAAKCGPELDIKEMVVVGTKKGPFGLPVPKEELRVTGRLKSLEENLKILLQKGRSLGFRIIAATQRASTKVITGDAKVNFPVQVCFRVPKEVDSKVVLDEIGAESLNGRGDGLIKSPEYLDTVRFQGFYYNKQ